MRLVWVWGALPKAHALGYYYFAAIGGKFRNRICGCVVVMVSFGLAASDVVGCLVSATQVKKKPPIAA